MCTFALDTDAAVLPAATALLVDTVGVLIGFVGHADTVDRKPVRIAVDLTDPIRSFRVTIGDAVELGPPPLDPNATLTMPAEGWLRLVAGRLGLSRTPKTVALESDVIDLAALRRVFPGY